MIHINSSKESAFVYLKTRKAEKTIIGFINGGYWYSFFSFWLRNFCKQKNICHTENKMEE